MKSFFWVFILIFLPIFNLCAQVDSSGVKKGKMSGSKTNNNVQNPPKDTSDTAIVNNIKQSILSAKADSTPISTPEAEQKIAEEKVLKKPFRLDQLRPRQVLILGLIIPSGGQIYNKKWWKLPIVYGGLAGVGYWVYNNRSNYLQYRRAYLYAVDNNPNTTPPAGNINSLKSNRDRYQSLYERSLLLGLGIYALIAIDGFVDAHLKTFEVNDNLSLKIQPKLWENSPQANLVNHPGASWEFIQPTLSLKFSF